MAWRGEVEDGTGWGGLVASKSEQRAEARQEALEKDAARYRWLKGRQGLTLRSEIVPAAARCPVDRNVRPRWWQWRNAMRINVYSQELTDEVILVEKGSNTGVVYHAAQLVLHSTDKLHHPPMDDDRSAVTFWLPKSQSRREVMAQAFERIAAIFREAPPASGLD